LKAVGIFSRLKIRDGKSAYLKDIPRTLYYLFQVSDLESSLVGLNDLMAELNLSERTKSMTE
jgi:aminoglycoside/choline kinase family phosphotransferase